MIHTIPTDYRLWTMDYGLWTMDYGLWTKLKLIPQSEHKIDLLCLVA